MTRWLRVALATVLALVAWSGLVLVGARAGWWRAPAPAKNDYASVLKAAERRYAATSRGNFAMVLIDRGTMAGSYFASHGRPVDGDTLFQVASMSKWLTAFGVMKLAEQKRIDLDAPVSRYLRRWRLPPGDFDNEQVTARRLLSHTAGLTDGLGFLGYRAGQTPPTLEAELSHPRDAQATSNGRIRVGARPGRDWRYSGGGYLILQLLIEDVTDETFNAYMRREILTPLGMTGSTFVDPDPSRLADDVDADGTRISYARFTALSAASLFTSTSDLTRFLQAQCLGPNGEPPGRGVLTPAALEAMRKPEAFLFGLPVWGLGDILYAQSPSGGYVIGHDGANAPAINTTARLDPSTCDGIVVLQSGSATLASEIGGDWLFWRAGVVGIDTLAMFEARRLLMLLGLGGIAILAAGGLVAVLGRGPARR